MLRHSPYDRIAVNPKSCGPGLTLEATTSIVHLPAAVSSSPSCVSNQAKSAAIIDLALSASQRFRFAERFHAKTLVTEGVEPRWLRIGLILKLSGFGDVSEFEEQVTRAVSALIACRLEGMRRK